MKKMSYVLFQEDGTYTEHWNVPEPVTLTEYLVWLTFEEPRWYSVELERGVATMKWQRVDVEDVPKGLRAYALLIL
jgi:hypothetical protein